MNRSVFRRSCPKFDSQLLVRSTGQRIPSGTSSLTRPVPWRRRLATIRSSRPMLGAQLADDVVVVATVEMERADVADQPATVDGVEGGFQQHAVVAVGAGDLPADRDPVAVGGDRPLPATFAPIDRVRAGPFTTEGCLVLGTVDGDVAEIEPDDAVVAGQGLIDQTVEHPGLEPLGAAAPQRRLRSLAEPTGHIPRAAGDQPEQDRFEAVRSGTRRR